MGDRGLANVGARIPTWIPIQLSEHVRTASDRREWLGLDESELSIGQHARAEVSSGVQMLPARGEGAAETTNPRDNSPHALLISTPRSTEPTRENRALPHIPAPMRLTLHLLAAASALLLLLAAAADAFGTTCTPPPSPSSFDALNVWSTRDRRGPKGFPKRTEMPRNLRVAFLGDSGLGRHARQVFEMVKEWGAEGVVHSSSSSSSSHSSSSSS
ncbi:hypothetical protein BDK51DRAFT_43489, partial [Blyttiomyces helicus]